MPHSTLPIIVPFRWDVSRPHQLGTLARAGAAPPVYPQFHDDLRDCCARVFAAACTQNDRETPDLFFVGRSPESLYDYLRGIVDAAPWRDRLHLLLFSMRDLCRGDVQQLYPAGVAAMRRYLASLRLDPRSLIARDRPAVLIDLVCHGKTFYNLIDLLNAWSVETRADWRSARRKLRIVAITMKHAADDWHRTRRQVTASLLKRQSATNVPIDARLWRYLADDQPKLSESYAPWRWGDERAAHPAHGDPHLAALRSAITIFTRARSRDEREAFISALVRHDAVRHASIRRLIGTLRLGPRRPRAAIREIIHERLLQGASDAN